MVIHHETLDAAQVTLTRCRTLVPACGRGTTCCRSWPSWRQQLQQLDELERLSRGTFYNYFSLRSLFSSLMKVLISLNWRYTEANRT